MKKHISKNNNFFLSPLSFIKKKIIVKKKK